MLSLPFFPSSRVSATTKGNFVVDDDPLSLAISNSGVAWECWSQQCFLATDDDDDDAYCGEDDGEKDSTRQAAHMSRRVAETTMLEAAMVIVFA